MRDYVSNVNIEEKFNRQVNRYDRMRRRNHLHKFRQELLAGLNGHVLELAVGVGTNFKYYSKNVKVTAIDVSPLMLQRAQEVALKEEIECNFILGDVEKIDFDLNSFDAIVSTLSFCGYEAPLSLLDKVGKWCKQNGHIRLLEHGISSNRALAFMQDAMDPLYYKFIGCHQNRNILGLVNKSNLEIIQSKTHWQQTMNLIWARPANKE